MIALRNKITFFFSNARQLKHKIYLLHIGNSTFFLWLSYWKSPTFMLTSTPQIYIELRFELRIIYSFLAHSTIMQCILNVKYCIKAIFQLNIYMQIANYKYQKHKRKIYKKKLFSKQLTFRTTPKANKYRYAHAVKVKKAINPQK